jgi:hypothetical protein
MANDGPPLLPRVPTPAERNRADREALARLARELRAILARYPPDDPRAAHLLADTLVLERVASWIGNTVTTGEED